MADSGKPGSERVKLMSLKEVAAHLNVSEKTVRRLGIPSTKIGRQRRYHPDMVKLYEVRNASPGAMLDWKAAS